eukprot:CAMPEP_0167771644 /NCGR_PEP_ID=MMETSP0111_2-20121227/396_1 /TAXON_ID=91324 /ORGANISM="Lotharella globosa, Strain CCCM811" /LENGTH=440 /DNA_ID=CAMNT_0007661027 /DNA_START=45 /DNA_END=1367 /DNA_ORIENTATION=-
MNEGRDAKRKISVQSAVLCNCVGYERGDVLCYSEPNLSETRAGLKGQCKRILENLDLKSDGRKMVASDSNINYHCLRHTVSGKALIFIIAVRNVSRDFTTKIATELAQFKDSYLSNNEVTSNNDYVVNLLSRSPPSVEKMKAKDSQRTPTASQRRLEFEPSLAMPAAVTESHSQPKERSIGRSQKPKISRGTKRRSNVPDEESSPFDNGLTQLDLKAAYTLKNKRRRIFNRTRRACVLCHKRKVRCKPNPNGNLRPCWHCFNDGRVDCVDYIPPARRSSVVVKRTVKKPPKEKALADHMNRHLGIPCNRTVDCSRPYKHPGHCKTGNRSAIVKKATSCSLSSHSSIPIPMPVWTRPLNLNASMGPLDLLNAVPMVSDAIKSVTAAEQRNHSLKSSAESNDGSVVDETTHNESVGAEVISDVADVAATLTAMSTMNVQVAG